MKKDKKFLKFYKKGYMLTNKLYKNLLNQFHVEKLIEFVIKKSARGRRFDKC